MGGVAVEVGPQWAVTGSATVAANWPVELVWTLTIQYQVLPPAGSKTIRMVWPA